MPHDTLALASRVASAGPALTRLRAVRCNGTPRMYIADIVLLYFITGEPDAVRAGCSGYPGASEPGGPDRYIHICVILSRAASTSGSALSFLHAGCMRLRLPAVPFRDITLRTSSRIQTLAGRVVIKGLPRRALRSYTRDVSQALCSARRGHPDAM